MSTLRSLLSFFFSSHATTWVQEKGPLFVFGIYIAVLFVASSLIPVFFFYGKRFRQWTAGKVEVKSEPGISVSSTPPSEMQSLNKILSTDTMNEKSLNHVVSIETVSTTDSIDKHVESTSTKSSL